MSPNVAKAVRIPRKEDFPHTEDYEASDIFCDVFEQNLSFFQHGAIRAAIDLGIFDLLTRPLTCSQLSVQLGTQPRRLSYLLNVLVLEGLLQYKQEAATYLARQKPEHKPMLPKYGWGRLAQVIRADRPLSEIEPSEHMPEGKIRFHDYLFETGYPAARRLWEVTGIGSGHLLDIGSGSGAYSAAFLEMHREVKATLVDRAEVLELAHRQLEKHASRLKFEARDAFEPVPGLYDIVLLANVLHLCSPSECSRLIAASSQPLQQGGCLVIKDLWIEPDRSGPAVSLYFAVNMALYTEGGNVYSDDQVCRWVKEAGLTDLRLLNTAHSLIVTATKPSKTNPQTEKNRH